MNEGGKEIVCERGADWDKDGWRRRKGKVRQSESHVRPTRKGGPRTHLQLDTNSIKGAFSMETIIRRVLDQPSLTDAVKNAAITQLLAGTASLSTPDANLLLDLGLELRTKV